MAKQYETVIGLEVHIELATKTKIFCGCSTEFGGAPNTHTCPVCTGMPGSLPVLNKQVVEYAVAVGLATNCTITQYCKFDRKNYFYPDNPQNYQISQLYLPICRNGSVEIEAVGEDGSIYTKPVRIHEIHMFRTFPHPLPVQTGLHPHAWSPPAAYSRRHPDTGSADAIFPDRR